MGDSSHDNNDIITHTIPYSPQRDALRRHQSTAVCPSILTINNHDRKPSEFNRYLDEYRKADSARMDLEV